MASRRAAILVVAVVLCVARRVAASPPGEQLGPMQAKLGGMSESCRLRGLPAPCSVACSMSARLCRACCAAVATFTTVSSAHEAHHSTTPGSASQPDVGPLPSDEEILTKGIAKSANCLALCSTFPAKRIRVILADPKANDADLKELTKQMSSLNGDLPWSTILESANSRPASISVLCENGKLSC